MHHALSGLVERLARDHAIPIAAIVSLTVVALGVIDADRQLRASAELGRNRTATVALLAVALIGVEWFLRLRERAEWSPDQPSDESA